LQIRLNQYAEQNCHETERKCEGINQLMPCRL